MRNAEWTGWWRGSHDSSANQRSEEFEVRKVSGVSPDTTGGSPLLLAAT